MKTHVLTFVIWSLSVLVHAERPAIGAPKVSFEAYPLPIMQTTVSFTEGIPANRAKLDDPFPNDFPPCTEVLLEGHLNDPALKKHARYFFPSHNVIRVYRISERYRYRTIQGYISHLQKLLKERPNSYPAEGTSHNGLPDYPPRNAGQPYHVKLSYVDAKWGKGILYLAQHRQGPGGFANNEEMTGIFQGITEDGAFYVSADFRITHPSLPDGLYGKPRHDDDFKTDSAKLARRQDDSFNPSLKKLRTWLASLKIE